VTALDNVHGALARMAELRMPLLVHGEVTDSTVDIFDREPVFLTRVAAPLIAAHPTLKVVLEHITTKEAGAWPRRRAGALLLAARRPATCCLCGLTARSPAAASALARSRLCQRRRAKRRRHHHGASPPLQPQRCAQATAASRAHRAPARRRRARPPALARPPRQPPPRRARAPPAARRPPRSAV
jgi:hypothetical protein